MEEARYADIIIDISHEALDKVFQYRVPLSLQERVKTGMKVRVPFGAGNREKEGYVIRITKEPSYDVDKIKDISGIEEGTLTVESQLIQVAAFLKRRYGSSMLQALKTVMPVKKRVRRKENFSLSLNMTHKEGEALLAQYEKKHYAARARLLRCLLSCQEMPAEKAVKESRLPLKEIKKLEAQGILNMRRSVAYRTPFHFSKKQGDGPLLNEEQRRAVEQFCKDFSHQNVKTYLLYGVTGSGKTEVYLAMLEEVLREKRGAIVLIPEISLTFQTVRRFYERFGDRIAVLHSRMSQGERSDAWERVEQGEADVVIGARSALFAPMKNLGLIILDEEHDGAYKSDSSPKYHARETAIYRASLSGASVVLGSATPSVESFYLARAGEYTLLTLTKRAGKAMLPSVKAVDLRQEFMRGNRSVFSGELREKIEERLQKKEQIVLFLNRRGFAGFVSCRSCGTVMKCPHCDVSMTYHKDGKLHCHYCGYETIYSRQCPVCKSPHVAAFGLGTEKVEAALYKEFPGIRVLRMDMDTTRKKNAHQEMLDTFARGEADVLLGTQMIVKGHDYPNVTLVGILAADLSLHSRDFRSGERTFQLLCQAAGRAGRGEKPGEVIIQSYSPEHYAITAALHHSYEEFYRQELAYRSMLRYPPCAHLLVMLVQCGTESEAALAAERIQKMVLQSQEEEACPVQILNPGQALISKLKDVYRQALYLKHESVERLEGLKSRLEPVLETHPLFAGVQIQFDFDPMNMI
ncbi:MAG: primosomal protein N' [Eubacteriales bacterium]|nr:primosomal protein N' [Eubacteriales bacterium]